MSLRSCPHQKFPTKSKMCYCQVNWAQSVLACLAKSRLSFEKRRYFMKMCQYQVNWAQLVLDRIIFIFFFFNPHSQLGDELLLVSLVLKVSFRSAIHYTFSSYFPKKISSLLSSPREKGNKSFMFLTYVLEGSKSIWGPDESVRVSLGQKPSTRQL